MNLKTSFCNKSIIKSDFKRLWWISALHTIIIFLLGTLLFITDNYRREYLFTETAEMLRHSSFLGSMAVYYVLALIVPVVLGVMLFSYMQSGKASAFAHSLPVTRGCMYVSHIISGVVMFTIPLVINGIIMMLFRLNGDFALTFKVSHLMLMLWEVFVYSILTFSAACGVSFIAGNTVASFIFTYIFGLLPLMAELFINFFAGTQLFGFVYNNDYSLSQILYVEPGYISTFKNTMLYLIFTAVFFAAGYILYRLRNIENHSEVVAFPKLRPVFIYGVGICCGCAGFAYFNGVWDVKNALLLIPLGVLGIVIAQMIVKKSFKIPEVYKPILGYSLFVIAVFVFFNFDLTGYERRIPDENDIEYVTFSQDSVNYDDGYYHDSKGNEYILKNHFSPDIKDKAMIGKVTALHKYLVDNKNTAQKYGEGLYLSYKLKNGRTLDRWYYINITAQKDLLENIIESDIIRQQYFPILRNDERKIESMSITDYRLNNAFKTLYPSDEDFERIIKALKKDLAAADYDEYAHRSRTLTAVNIYFTLPGYYKNGKQVDETELHRSSESYYIRSSYANTIAILSEFGFFDALPGADDVETIGVRYYDDTAYEYYEGVPYSRMITAKEDIEVVMNYMTEYNYEYNDNAMITVFYKDGTTFDHYFNISNDNLPECLR